MKIEEIKENFTFLNLQNFYLTKDIMFRGFCKKNKPN
jgi:hypothetical protein